MKMLNKWVIVLGFFLAITLVGPVQAQSSAAETQVAANANTQEIEMADNLRKDGKIYVVVGCVLVVLAGMIFYLVSIDRKVSKLEKQYKSWFVVTGIGINILPEVDFNWLLVCL